KGEDRLIVLPPSDGTAGGDCSVKNKLRIDLLQSSLQETAGRRIACEVERGPTDVESRGLLRDLVIAERHVLVLEPVRPHPLGYGLKLIHDVRQRLRDHEVVLQVVDAKVFRLDVP